MKVHELVTRFAAAVSRAEPMAAARAELEQLKGNIAEVDEALRYISGVAARQVFYSFARPHAAQGVLSSAGRTHATA